MRYIGKVDQFFFRAENSKNHKCDHCGTTLWEPVNPGKKSCWVKIGGYVAAVGVEGVVKEVTLFYTVILTLDNKRITVPNGSLMNANITDFSSEELRRVDLNFACGKNEAPAKIQDLMITAMKATPKVLTDPEPFARISGGSNEAMEFTVRAWCKSEDYWDVYFDLTQRITESMAENSVKAPAVRITTDSQK